MAKIKITSVNHVGLPISDRAMAMKMYRETVGLQVIPHQVDGNTLAWTETLDGSMVHLIDPPAAGSPDLRQHVAFEVEDLDPVIEALADAGIELEADPGVRHDGQRHLFVRDPDGNRIEICTRGDHSDTKRKVDENGYTTEG
jgi:catechol 2,3-dioxygenase-like lactoylglutathione lyase family enzyme